jgi:hypothetical protein
MPICLAFLYLGNLVATQLIQFRERTKRKIPITKKKNDPELYMKFLLSMPIVSNSAERGVVVWKPNKLSYNSLPSKKSYFATFMQP